MKTVLLRILIVCFMFAVSWGIQAQTKRAFLIGISEYNTNISHLSDDDWTNIHGANDVELLSHTLKEQNFKIKKQTKK